VYTNDGRVHIELTVPAYNP